MGRSTDGRRAGPQGAAADTVSRAAHWWQVKDWGDLAQGLVAGGEQAMNRTWRRILTAKMLVLSALAPAGIVVSVHLAQARSLTPTHPGIHGTRATRHT